MAAKSYMISAVLIVVGVCSTAAVPVTVDLSPSDQLHIVSTIQEVEDRPSPLRVVVAEPAGVYPHQAQPQQFQHQQQHQWHHRQQQQSLGRPMEPLYHQQGWEGRYQPNHLNKEQMYQHGESDELPSASHFCIDGRCYALTPTQETAAEHQSQLNIRNVQEHHRLVKRSIDTNDVRQRFQQQSAHHLQQQQQMPTQQHQFQRPAAPAAQAPGQQQHPKQQNFRGQPVTGRPQQQDWTTTSPKDTASSAAFEKAVMDFEKISDKISDMVSTFMIPIVRSSFDEGSSVLMIELDYSEAPNTAEATVEIEDEV